jgi:hypothetical protein
MIWSPLWGKAMEKDNNLRPDKEMAALVDDGIELAAVCGREKIYVCLAACGVPDAVLERVLCEPERRRAPAKED